MNKTKPEKFLATDARGYTRMGKDFQPEVFFYNHFIRVYPCSSVAKKDVA
jgi:hypothetical protein